MTDLISYQLEYLKPGKVRILIDLNEYIHKIYECLETNADLSQLKEQAFESVSLFRGLLLWEDVLNLAFHHDPQRIQHINHDYKVSSIIKSNLMEFIKNLIDEIIQNHEKNIQNQCHLDIEIRCDEAQAENLLMDLAPEEYDQKSDPIQPGYYLKIPKTIEDSESEDIHITISDNGPGFSPFFLDKVKSLKAKKNYLDRRSDYSLLITKSESNDFNSLNLSTHDQPCYVKKFHDDAKLFLIKDNNQCIIYPIQKISKFKSLINQLMASEKNPCHPISLSIENHQLLKSYLNTGEEPVYEKKSPLNKFASALFGGVGQGLRSVIAWIDFGMQIERAHKYYLYDEIPKRSSIDFSNQTEGSGAVIDIHCSKTLIPKDQSPKINYLIDYESKSHFKFPSASKHSMCLDPGSIVPKLQLSPEDHEETHLIMLNFNKNISAYASKIRLKKNESSARDPNTHPLNTLSLFSATPSSSFYSAPSSMQSSLSSNCSSLFGSTSSSSSHFSLAKQNTELLMDTDTVSSNAKKARVYSWKNH